MAEFGRQRATSSSSPANTMCFQPIVSHTELEEYRRIRGFLGGMTDIRKVVEAGKKLSHPRAAARAGAGLGLSTTQQSP